ncbi:translocation/assembly module TamB domain-containing protein [Benzoatithermus flavus]|uniref:Translocation/assembly module TamB domain-containing protein n=1 Tax=Benzoatithermus flavus TaxID=3108223 RepID=A0ABU8XRA9_9PROT
MLRRILWTLAGLLTVLVLLAAGLLGFAQTRSGKDRIAQFLSRAFATSERRIELSGLDGFVPFDIRLASLRLGDREGVWLEARDVRLALTPSALLRGIVLVREAGARRVALHRLPHAPEPPPPQKPFSLPELPELPGSLPRVLLQRLSVDELALDQPVLGEPATFALVGQAGTGTDGRAVEASLSLHRTDRPTAAVDLEAGLDLVGHRLRLDLEGSETGGLLAAATGRPEAGALQVSLAGEGPLSDWQGRLTVEAEHLAGTTLALSLAYAEEKRLGVRGRLTAEPGLLPPETADLLGGGIDLVLAARATGPQRIALEQLRLQVADMVLDGAGSADLAADTADADLTLHLPDLGRLGGLAKTPLTGSGTIRLRASGPVRQPDLRLMLDGKDIAAANAALHELGAAFDIAFLSPFGEGDPALRVAGRAEAAGLVLGGQALGEDGRATFDFAASLPRAGEATLERLALRSPLLELDGHGRVDPKRLAGAFRLDAGVPDLAAALRAALPPEQVPPDLAGAVRLGADVMLADRAQRIEVALTGGGQGLHLPSGAEALTGPAPNLEARVSIEPGSAVTVSSLVLAGEAVRLEGEPRYGLADQSLAGTVRLSLPALARLESLLHRPIGGRADLGIELGGTVPAPALRLQGEARPFTVAGEAFDRIGLAATVQGEATAAAGSIRLAAERARETVTLASDYRLAGRQLALSGLTLEGPGTRLSGKLDVALDGPRATGGLAGEVRDLAALAAWHRQNLAGRVALDLVLSTPDGRQDARLRLEATGLAGAFGSLRSARLDAAVQDALARPALDTRLEVQSFTRPGLGVETAALTAKGPLADLALSLRTQGRQGEQPFRVNSAAKIAALAPRRTITLTALAGSVAGQDIRLLRPATASLGDDGALTLDRLALRWGPAELQASLDLGGGRVRADASLAGLSLELLHGLGAPAVSGRANARLTLGGPARAPEGTAELRVQNLALDPAAAVKPDAVLEARLGRGRLDATLRLSELGAQPIVARADVPATLSLEPAAFALDRAAPLTGSIRGPIDLARVARLAALDGVQTTGTLQLALDLAGTVQRPEIGGAVDLAGGSMQEIGSGVVLRDLELHARGLGRQIVLQTLAARDPTGGRLTGRGSVALLDDGGVRYDATLQTEKARVLDNGLGTVVLSGNVAANGDLAAASVRGALTVERADIAIPDDTGPKVPVIEVREINGSRAEAGPDLALRPAGPSFDLRLDLAIDIPARLFVRGRGLDSEWGGKLQIEGPASEPEIVGALEVRRGFMDLLDRRFTISRGEISFVGKEPPLPMIDLEATAKTVDIQAVVRLKGPAADPKLTLASEPELPQDEILSRLLFGRSVARITPVQGLRLASAVRQLQGGGGLSDVLGALRRAVGIDTLDVESGEKPGESTARAGKYVSDNVFVEVERGVQQGTGRARVQIELTPNLSVGTQVTEQSQTGIGLQWRYDY